MPTGETKVTTLKPGTSTGMDQDKALNAPQKKTHNGGSSISDSGKGKRPSVVK